MTKLLLTIAFIVFAYLPAASLLGHVLRRIRMSYPTATAARNAVASGKGYTHTAIPAPSQTMQKKSANLSERLTPQSRMPRPLPRECAA